MTTTTTPFAIPLDPLDDVVAYVDGQAGCWAPDPWDQPNKILVWEPCEAGTLLHVTTLNRDHPFDDIIAFRAPPTTAAAGIVWFGTSLPTPKEPHVKRARLAYAMSRSGELRGLSSRENGDVHESVHVNQLTDSLRRVLGLPTGPPPMSTATLFAEEWLHAVLSLARRGGVPRWPAVARLHPAMVLARRSDPSRSPRALVSEARRLEEWLTWSVLRRRVMEGTTHYCQVPPEAAAWMDDGMFARWMLAEFPPVSEMLDELAAIQPEALCDAIRTTLEQLDVEH